jgi:hypothetical protein
VPAVCPCGIGASLRAINNPSSGSADSYSECSLILPPYISQSSLHILFLQLLISIHLTYILVPRTYSFLGDRFLPMPSCANNDRRVSTRDQVTRPHDKNKICKNRNFRFCTICTVVVEKLEKSVFMYWLFCQRASAAIFVTL